MWSWPTGSLLGGYSTLVSKSERFRALNTGMIVGDIQDSNLYGYTKVTTVIQIPVNGYSDKTKSLFDFFSRG